MTQTFAGYGDFEITVKQEVEGEYGLVTAPLLKIVLRQERSQSSFEVAGRLFPDEKARELSSDYKGHNLMDLIRASQFCTDWGWEKLRQVEKLQGEVDRLRALLSGCGVSREQIMGEEK